MTNWSDIQRNASQPGSRILTAWKAEQEAKRASVISLGHPSNPEVAEFLGGGSATAAGMAVTPDSAMRVGAVFACVRVLAESMASLPLVLYRRLPNGGKERATKHPLYHRVGRRPNGWQTRFEWMEQGMASLCLRGAAYRRILKDRSLIPMNPVHVNARLLDSGKLAYDYQPPNGPRETLLQSEVLRVPFMVVDQVRPLSVIGAQREAIGASLASQDYASRFWANDAKPTGGWIETDKDFKDEDTERKFRASWQAYMTGANRHKTAVLKPGMKYHDIGMSNQDAQFLETRKFQRSEIAGFFRVPPHMIGDLDKANYSTLEHNAISFVVNGITPNAVRWEQALSRDLLSDYEQDDYFFEFNVDGLLRGDIVSRYAAYAIGRQWGWLNPDEIRSRENMDPIEGGDVYLTPLNMTPTDLLAKVISDKLKQPEKDPQNA